MNKLTLIALSTLLSTGAAMADGLSRDEVVAELVRARNAGELTALHSESFGYTPAASAASTKSRAQVQGELRAARASGELALLNSNNPSFTHLSALNPAPAAAPALLAGQPAAAR